MRIYIQRLQQQVKPNAQTGSTFARIWGWLMFIALLVIGAIFGALVFFIGLLMAIPLLWRKRRELKSVWQFSRAAKQAQQRAQAQQRYRQDQRDDSIIEGEYRVKKDQD